MEIQDNESLFKLKNSNIYIYIHTYIRNLYLYDLDARIVYGFCVFMFAMKKCSKRVIVIALSMQAFWKQYLV